MQYRYKEAIEAYQSIMQIRSDDQLLYIRIAGAYLTIDNSIMLTTPTQMRYSTEQRKKALLTIWAYGIILRENNHLSPSVFLKCMPCGDEMAVTVVYWHTLCYSRLGDASVLLNYISNDMCV